LASSISWRFTYRSHSRWGLKRERLVTSGQAAARVTSGDGRKDAKRVTESRTMMVGRCGIFDATFSIISSDVADDFDGSDRSTMICAISSEANCGTHARCSS
jgi:hypothetical protein